MIFRNLNLLSPGSSLPVKIGSGETTIVLREVSIEIQGTKIKRISKDIRGQGIDLKGRWVIPGFIDPHTHSIFCGERSDEIDVRKEFGYDGLLERGGGIYRTVEQTIKCSEDALYNETKNRLQNMIYHGTVAFEVKTGYGIEKKHEEKMIKVAERLRKDGFDVAVTLLAHVPPKGLSDLDYLPEFLNMMQEFKGRYDYVDVFCDSGAFGVGFLIQVLKKAEELHIPSRIHLNEISNFNAIERLKDFNIVSLDHMIETREEELAYVKAGITILPTTALFLNKRTDFFKLIKKHRKIVALGSDLSPNSYVYSMPFVIALSRQISPFSLEELITMSTINSAYLLNRNSYIGSIEEGKDASFIVLEMPPQMIGYEFYEDPIYDVILRGESVRKQIDF